MGSSTGAYSNPYSSTSGKGGSGMYGSGSYNPYVNRSNFGGSGMYGGGGSKGGTSPYGGYNPYSGGNIIGYGGGGTGAPIYGGGGAGKGGAVTPEPWTGDLNTIDWEGWRPQQANSFSGPMVYGYYNANTGEYVNYQDPNFGAFDNAYNAYYQTYDPDVNYYEPDDYGWNMSTGWYNPTTGAFISDRESEQWGTVSEGYQSYLRALQNYQRQQFQNWYGGFPGKGGGGTGGDSFTLGPAYTDPQGRTWKWDGYTWIRDDVAYPGGNPYFDETTGTDRRVNMTYSAQPTLSPWGGATYLPSGWQPISSYVVPGAYQPAGPSDISTTNYDPISVEHNGWTWTKEWDGTKWTYYRTDTAGRSIPVDEGAWNYIYNQGDGDTDPTSTTEPTPNPSGDVEPYVFADTTNPQYQYYQSQLDAYKKYGLPDPRIVSAGLTATTDSYGRRWVIQVQPDGWREWRVDQTQY